MTKNKRPSTAPGNKPLLVCPKLLRRWALPQPDEDGDKEARGRVLVVSGALGFLARELLAEIPPLMARLAAGRT